MTIFLQNVDLLGIRRLMVFAKDTSTQRVFFPFCRLKGRRLKEHWTVTQRFLRKQHGGNRLQSNYGKFRAASANGIFYETKRIHY